MAAGGECRQRGESFPQLASSQTSAGEERERQGVCDGAAAISEEGNVTVCETKIMTTDGKKIPRSQCENDWKNG